MQELAEHFSNYLGSNLVLSAESTGWRMGVRLSIMLGILFIGESIPRFDKILALIGGTSVALLTFILPSYCYLNLVKQSQAEGQKTM